MHRLVLLTMKIKQNIDVGSNQRQRGKASIATPLRRGNLKNIPGFYVAEQISLETFLLLFTCGS
jgi:hypothetical protein